MGVVGGAQVLEALLIAEPLLQAQACLSCGVFQLSVRALCPLPSYCFPSVIAGVYMMVTTFCYP